MAPAPAAPLWVAVSRCPSSCGSFRPRPVCPGPLSGAGLASAQASFVRSLHVASVAGSHVPLTTRAPGPRLQQGAVLVPLPVRPPGCLPLPAAPRALAGCVCLWVLVGKAPLTLGFLWGLWRLGLMGPSGAVGSTSEADRGEKGTPLPAGLAFQLQVFPRRGELTLWLSQEFSGRKPGLGPEGTGGEAVPAFPLPPPWQCPRPVPGPGQSSRRESVAHCGEGAAAPGV